MQNIGPSKQLMAWCLLKVNSLGRKKKKKEKTTPDFERLRRHKHIIEGILIEYYFRKYQETWGNFNMSRISDAIRELLLTFLGVLMLLWLYILHTEEFKEKCPDTCKLF